jgi:glutamate N-acetyltransferase/amino-acid N-acetyltransferase
MLYCISVDGDTSTNDSIFFLSNGLAGNKKIENADSENYKLFYQNLWDLMEHMAKEIVNDGEGITKFITIDILNTQDRDKAKAVAMSIANSPLVKTALFGEDLNWGRIMMAVGKAMTKMDCSIIDVTINNFEIVKSGEPVISQEDYLKAKQSLKNRNVDIVVDFKQGIEKIRVWTCDYSYDYVKINAHYTT